MRIISGSLGGRRFNPPSGLPARPTTDLAREGLFNILTHLLDPEGLSALDLFSGTGGVAYELISRGASKVTAVEQHGASVSFIKKTAEGFGITEQLNLIRGDVFRYLSNAPKFDLVFADPPYALPKMDDLADLMLEHLAPEGIAILEHDQRHSFETHPQWLRSKAYGDTVFTFFTSAAQ